MPRVGRESMQFWLRGKLYTVFIEFGTKHNGMVFASDVPTYCLQDQLFLEPGLAKVHFYQSM